MYIINPPSSYVPTYRIGPFRTIDVTINNELPQDDSIDHYFDLRFGVGKYSYHYRARRALNFALQHYNLKKDDEVAILTTTNNFYISSCVTKEIDKFCSWSRKISEKTKIILVNHEFGIPFKGIDQLRKYKLPIIEDCAHSFYSQDENDHIGKIGDFVIYSFPKMFPIQIGSLLVSNLDLNLEKNNYLELEYLIYTKKVISHYIKFKKETILKRLTVYRMLESKMAELNFLPRFKLETGSVPGVFMFKVQDEALDLNELKNYVQRHGIESSVFYGEQSFFIPVHQYLSEDDVIYFVSVIKNFIQRICE